MPPEYDIATGTVVFVALLSNGSLFSSPDQKEERGKRIRYKNAVNICGTPFFYFAVFRCNSLLEPKLYFVATLIFELLVAVMEDGLFLPWWGFSTDDFISHDSVVIHEAPAGEAMIAAFLRAGARSETAEGFIAGKRPVYILLAAFSLHFAAEIAVNLSTDRGFCMRIHAVLWRASFRDKTKNKVEISNFQITVGPQTAIISKVLQVYGWSGHSL